MYRQAYSFTICGLGGFCFGRGAEMMWPDASPWMWWGIGVAVFIIGLGGLVAYDHWVVPWLKNWEGFSSLWNFVGWIRINRLVLVRRAYLAPSNGIHIAKLIKQARNVEVAREIFDIFDGSSGQKKVADAYSAYAQALLRFDCQMEATNVLKELDNKGIHEIDIADAMNRFFYPQDDEETVKDLEDRMRGEGLS